MRLIWTLKPSSFTSSSSHFIHSPLSYHMIGLSPPGSTKPFPPSIATIFLQIEGVSFPVLAFIFKWTFQWTPSVQGNPIKQGSVLIWETNTEDLRKQRPLLTSPPKPAARPRNQNSHEVRTKKNNKRISLCVVNYLGIRGCPSSGLENYKDWCDKLLYHPGPHKHSNPAIRLIHFNWHRMRGTLILSVGPRIPVGCSTDSGWEGGGGGESGVPDWQRNVSELSWILDLVVADNRSMLWKQLPFVFQQRLENQISVSLRTGRTLWDLMLQKQLAYSCIRGGKRDSVFEHVSMYD